MEILSIVAIIVVIVAILAYYGFMDSVEVSAGMANREIRHLDDVHMVAVTKRTASLDDDIDDKVIEQAMSVKAKLAAMRNPTKS